MLDMKDSKEVLDGRVQINAVSDEALQAMVDFIYTEKIEIEDTEVIQDLLVLSNKYILDTLAEKMIPKFIENIDADNCIDAYFFGFLHEYESLKLAAFHTILSTRNKSGTEEKLDTFSKSYPKESENLKNKIKSFNSDEFGFNYFSKKQLGYKNCVEAFFFGLTECDDHDLVTRAKIVIAHNWKKIQTEESRLKLISEIRPKYYHEVLKKEFDEKFREYHFKPNEFDKDALQHPMICIIKGRLGNERNDYISRASRIRTELELLRRIKNSKHVMKVSPELGDIIGVETATIGELERLFKTYLEKNNIGERKRNNFLGAGIMSFKINEDKLDELWPVWGFAPDDKLAKHLLILSDSEMAHFGPDSS